MTKVVILCLNGSSVFSHDSAGLAVLIVIEPMSLIQYSVYAADYDDVGKWLDCKVGKVGQALSLIDQDKVLYIASG